MSAVECRVHASADDYLATARDTLAKDEVANNLVLGVPLALSRHPDRIRHAPYLVTVHEGDRFAGCAVMTPPHHLVVHVEAGTEEGAEAGASDGVVQAIAADVVRRGLAVPGVNGRAPYSEAFAKQWQAATETGYSLTTALRVYILREVIPPVRSRGLLRPATLEDVQTVAEYRLAFDIEAVGAQPGEPNLEHARQSIGDGNVYLWERDGVAVCMVCKARPLLRSATIAPVYTVPSERGKGYASNATAALSQLLLEEGWESCCLFTDLGNPTSNSVYQKIGYQRVCDYADFTFDGG